VGGMVEDTVTLAVEEEGKLATLVVELVTCRVTVYRARNATTALEWVTLAGIALNLNEGLAILVDPKVTSLVTALVLLPLRVVLERCHCISMLDLFCLLALL